jgi:ATP/maltotriose-dependent transcriptional regulator MalT
MEYVRASVPRRSAVEIDRPALLARLAQRWHVPLTLVVAGPGFGKSTVLAQAYRADELRPPGLQGWVGIDPGLEEDAFVSAVFAALGAGRRSADPLTDLIRLLDAAAPVPVCLVVDDAHRLGVRSSATTLLRELVRRLPAHVHLVLASRTAPPVPLAALRAADRVLEIGEPDLVFTAQECTVLAALLGQAPDVAHGDGGPVDPGEPRRCSPCRPRTSPEPGRSSPSRASWGTWCRSTRRPSGGTSTSSSELTSPHR